jgi:hypothetical protein
MDWKNWFIVILVVFTGGWMLFDGARALILGDYVTPKSGQYSGQLGPWSNLVEAIGIEPGSTFMKSIFVAYGLIALASVVCFVAKTSWSNTFLVIVCILGLWYLPIGTVANLVTLILLWAGRR